VSRVAELTPIRRHHAITEVSPASFFEPTQLSHHTRRHDQMPCRSRPSAIILALKVIGSP
jgi:hypothetical protein